MRENTAGGTLRIGLASVLNASPAGERLETVELVLRNAAEQGVAIVCFPEAYIPGLRGMDFPVPPPDQDRQEAALARVRGSAKRYVVAVVIGMEWRTDKGLHNVAFVVGRDGAVVSGAQLVFHPQLTGSDIGGPTLTHWGDPTGPYYEKAMIARAAENAIYFASVNYAMRHQESATSLIGPDGECIAHVPYGQEHLLVYDLDLARATRLYAERFNPAFYPSSDERTSG